MSCRPISLIAMYDFASSNGNLIAPITQTQPLINATPTNDVVIHLKYTPILPEKQSIAKPFFLAFLFGYSKIFVMVYKIIITNIYILALIHHRTFAHLMIKYQTTMIFAQDDGTILTD